MVERSPRSQSGHFFSEPSALESPKSSRGPTRRRGSGDDDSLQGLIGAGQKVVCLNFVEFKKVELANII
jgi:hypothetical protein